MGAKKKTPPCWCGDAAGVARCCEPYLLGATQPQTAVALMRSRYSAYVTKNADYLLATWHPETRPSALDFDEQLRWLELKVLDTEEGGEFDATGTVTFIAHYRIAGRGHRLEERSRFSKIDGRWMYKDAAA